MKTFYLAHSFTTRKTTRKWELKIESKYNINLDNPFYDTCQRTDMKELDKMKEGSKEQKEYFKQRDTTELVDRDLEKIRKSDGLAAFLKLNTTKSSLIGTPMEIFFAARILKIPVYVVTKKFVYHPWIKKFATQTFITKKDFEEYIKKEFGLRSGI